MAVLMKMLDQRKGDLSDEKFANIQLNISASTLSRYRKGTEIGVDGLKKMTPTFVKAGDAEMVGAFAVYALGLNVPIGELRTVGQAILDAASSS